MINFKPCPFCAITSVQVIKSNKPAISGFQCECTDCGARGPIYENKSEAIRGWNEGISDIEKINRRK
ncbi:restriction alleviation protein, Lar family [Methanococcoides sp. SA1]|nr:restriction alleviation protein, Lar family [Methanococcoides sp. SA1]